MYFYSSRQQFLRIYSSTLWNTLKEVNWKFMILLWKLLQLYQGSIGQPFSHLLWLFRIIGNYLELLGTIWNYLELLGIIWNYLELSIINLRCQHCPKQTHSCPNRSISTSQIRGNWPLQSYKFWLSPNNTRTISKNTFLQIYQLLVFVFTVIVNCAYVSFSGTPCVLSKSFVKLVACHCWFWKRFFLLFFF